MVKVIQRWVSSGPSIKIQWYVVDIVESCPVAIPSDVYAECTSPDRKQCGKKCNDKPQYDKPQFDKPQYDKPQ